MAMSAELALLQRYFGGVNRILAQGQMRQMAGGLMSSSVARGAQVLGFKNMELVEELQLSAEPPAPPKRAKYASGGQQGANA